MPRVTCRCGESLNVPANGPERVVCPKCAAKIRVRRKAKVGDADGFIRFSCPCGRRLKVRAEVSTEEGKCPDCGQVVRAPTAREAAEADLDVATEELSKEDLAKLDQWAKERLGTAAPAPAATQITKPATGLRVCPQCGRPVHSSAVACRECGAAVPQRK